MISSTSRDISPTLLEQAAQTNTPLRPCQIRQVNLTVSGLPTQRDTVLRPSCTGQLLLANSNSKLT